MKRQEFQHCEDLNSSIKAKVIMSYLPPKQQLQEQPILQFSNSLSEKHISYQNLQCCLLEFPRKEHKQLIRGLNIQS